MNACVHVFVDFLIFFRLAAAFKVIPVSFANFAILFALVFCGCREAQHRPFYSC